MPTVFRFEYLISERELEPVYLHVNHARALLLMEASRLAFLEHIGFPSPALIAQDIFPVVARIDAGYKRELFGGPVTITCEEGRIEGKSMFLRQRVINEREKCAVEALFELKFMQGATKRAIFVPSELTQAFEGFFASS